MTKFQVGDTIAYRGGPNTIYPVGYGYSLWFEPGDLFTVVKALKTVVHVRPVETESTDVFSLTYDQVVAPEDYRPLGQAPSGGIAIDDPRISWIWDDVNSLAKAWNLCSEFNRFTRALDLPGPIKTFNGKVKITEDMTVTVKVEARSQAEADRLASERYERATVGSDD